ncbi:MAG: short-chain dehydrogenase/reductase [Frankiales bacterium]|nr:short-chain dehydrogenase/reductase [Frankiales bacterium]
MSSTLTNPVAVVTGSSRGIGKGIAIELGGRGTTVYATGRTVQPGTRPRPVPDQEPGRGRSDHRRTAVGIRRHLCRRAPTAGIRPRPRRRHLLLRVGQLPPRPGLRSHEGRPGQADRGHGARLPRARRRRLAGARPAPRGRWSSARSSATATARTEPTRRRPQRSPAESSRPCTRTPNPPAHRPRRHPSRGRGRVRSPRRERQTAARPPRPARSATDLQRHGPTATER